MVNCNLIGRSQGLERRFTIVKTRLMEMNLSVVIFGHVKALMNTYYTKVEDLRRLKKTRSSVSLNRRVMLNHAATNIEPLAP